MRVLIVSHHAPPHLGGVEQVVRLEAEALLQAGHSVHWLTSDGDGDGEDVRPQDGLTLERVRAWHLPERRFGVAYPLFSPSIVPRLWRAVGAADLVHVHGLVFPGSVLGAVFARLRGKRCILTDHGGILRYRSRLATWALRALIETAGRVTARCAHRCIALNSDLEALLRRLSGRSVGDGVRFLPNPVEGARFVPPSAAERDAARAALGWRDSAPRVLSVGRLLPHKGADLLLAGMGEPPTARAAIEPKLVWCGPDGDPQLLARWRAHPATEYLPARPQHELRTLYHAADVFALPSRNEGFPLVVQEALACGLPVVTTDAPGYAPYRDLPGLYLCALEPRAVRRAIERALEGPRPQRDDLASSPMQLDAARWLDDLLREGAARAGDR